MTSKWLVDYRSLNLAAFDDQEVCFFFFVEGQVLWCRDLAACHWIQTYWPPMLMQTVHLSHTHTGNALVSCVCVAVDHLLLSVEPSCEWSGVFTFYWSGQQRDLPVLSGNLCPGIKPQLYVQLQVSSFLFVSFYMLSYALQSMVVQCNAVHQTLITPWIVCYFMPV